MIIRYQGLAEFGCICQAVIWDPNLTLADFFLMRIGETFSDLMAVWTYAMLYLLSCPSTTCTLGICF